MGLKYFLMGSGPGQTRFFVMTNTSPKLGLPYYLCALISHPPLCMQHRVLQARRGISLAVSAFVSSLRRPAKGDHLGGAFASNDATEPRLPQV